MALLADLLVGHLIVEVEIAVELGLHVILVDIELVAGLAAERRLLVLVALGNNVLATSAASEAVALRVIKSLPEIPLHILVLLEGAKLGVLESVTLLQIGRADGRVLARAVERRCMEPTSSLHASGGEDESGNGLHDVDVR